MNNKYELAKNIPLEFCQVIDGVFHYTSYGSTDPDIECQITFKDISSINISEAEVLSTLVNKADSAKVFLGITVIHTKGDF